MLLWAIFKWLLVCFLVLLELALVDLDQFDVVSLTEALRGFLQDLPAPIIPASIYNELVYTAQGTERWYWVIIKGRVSQSKISSSSLCLEMRPQVIWCVMLSANLFSLCFWSATMVGKCFFSNETFYVKLVNNYGVCMESIIYHLMQCLRNA